MSALTGYDYAASIAACEPQAGGWPSFLVAHLAQAQPNVEQARVLYESASAQYQRQNFGVALEGFRRAYELMQGHHHQSYVLYDIGLCYERLGQPEQAIQNLHAFLRDSGPDAPNRSEAQDLVTELETRVRLRGGGSSMSPIGPAVLIGAGVALITGLVTGAVALSMESDLNGRCMNGDCAGSLRGEYSDMMTVAMVTDVLLSVSAAAAVTGFFLSLFVREGAGSASAVSAACGPNGCLAMLRGAW